MLSPVPDCRRALAAQASKLSRAGARNDRIGFLRHAVLEHSTALEHEAARFPRKAPDDSLEADERGRAVAAVHHQVLNVPLAVDIAGERFCDGGSRQLWLVVSFAVGFLVPAFSGESAMRDVFHFSSSATGRC